MIHYHGGPITPDPCAIKAWRARHAFVSFAAPQQIGLAARLSQSFALDNGAFSFWKAKRPVNWLGYYCWVDEWRHHPGCDFAIIPDIIDGSEADNDQLANEWPFPRAHSAVVWHVNESVERLVRLTKEYPRVCIGSSGAFDVSRPSAFLERMAQVMPLIVDRHGRPLCKLHGLRMLNPAIFQKLPLASADSTNVARNIGIDSAWRGTYSPTSKETRASILVERIESVNGACAWEPHS